MTDMTPRKQAELLAMIEAGDLAGLAEYGRAVCRRSVMPQVWALIHAGWSFELPGEPDDERDPEPGSWRWRRPGKRPGRPGRLFASTGQAYNAMMREAGGTPR